MKIMIVYAVGIAGVATLMACGAVLGFIGTRNEPFHRRVITAVITPLPVFVVWWLMGFKGCAVQ